VSARVSAQYCQASSAAQSAKTWTVAQPSMQLSPLPTDDMSSGVCMMCHHADAHWVTQVACTCALASRNLGGALRTRTYM
jgi:hypothetical protein